MSARVSSVAVVSWSWWPTNSMLLFTVAMRSLVQRFLTVKLDLAHSKTRRCHSTAASLCKIFSSYGEKSIGRSTNTLVTLLSVEPVVRALVRQSG